MPFYIGEIFRREGIIKWVGIAVVIVIVGGLVGYYGFQMAKERPEMFKSLAAKIVEFFKVQEEAVEEEAPEEIALEEGELEIVLPEEKNYLEVAERGEGITHLARRALKEYLSENSQNFDVTPEHKVYIEDYLTKQKGGHWLNLEETMEFSGDSIQEAIDEAETLTPEQLENLTQFSQLVPSLNY